MTQGSTDHPDAAPSPPASSPGGEPHGRFFATGREQAVDEHDRVLWDALHGLTEGGKRFRPALLTSMHAALGGTDHAAADSAAEQGSTEA